MQLGEPDAPGRCRPVPIEGSEHVIGCDEVIVAVGNRANPRGVRWWRHRSRVGDRDLGGVCVRSEL
jgi:NADPH-dependent glutamate synthase beta subunit-like oxidoreductase